MVPNIEVDRFYLEKVKSGELEVHPHGQVINKKTNKEMGSFSDGYIRIYKKQNKKTRTIYLHRLIWLAVKGPIPKRKLVNHKNGNKLDCHIENLELVSYSQNTRHAIEMGLFKPHFSKKYEKKK